MGVLDPSSPEYATAADARITSTPNSGIVTDISIEAQVGIVLDGLGFRKEDWPRRTEEFSGGWADASGSGKVASRKTQFTAAGRAYEPPRSRSPATGWKKYLKDYPGAYVLISHDRYFLDVTVNKNR